MAKGEGGSSARRALRVMKALKGRSLQGLAVREIATILHESEVNVCRALDALEAEGLAAKLDTGRWALTVGMLQIAESYQREMDAATSRIAEIRQRVAAGAHN